jgi:hypothetical protein
MEMFKLPEGKDFFHNPKFLTKIRLRLLRFIAGDAITIFNIKSPPGKYIEIECGNKDIFADHIDGVIFNVSPDRYNKIKHLRV